MKPRRGGKRKRNNSEDESCFLFVSLVDKEGFVTRRSPSIAFSKIENLFFSKSKIK